MALGSSTNKFTGAVSLTSVGNMIVAGNMTGNLTTSTTGSGSSTTFGLTAIGGDLSATGTGVVNQNAAGISVAGVTTLNSGSVISLGSATNNFVGAVNATGTNLILSDNIGGLLLGNINANSNLSVTSLGGAISQNAGTSVMVTGGSNLTADKGVTGVGNAK
jgi:hypothetical protein